MKRLNSLRVGCKGIPELENKEIKLIRYMGPMISAHTSKSDNLCFFQKSFLASFKLNMLL